MTVPETLTCLRPIAFNSGSTASNINLMISCSISVVELFEVNSDNTFFGLSRVAAIKFADFAFSLVSTNNMAIFVGHYQRFNARVLIFR